jgi:hypothetical protein
LGGEATFQVNLGANMSEHESGPVTVFRTNDPALLAVAQSLLEGADIEFFVPGQAVSSLYLEVPPVPTACRRFVLPPRTPTRRERAIEGSRPLAGLR